MLRHLLITLFVLAVAVSAYGQCEIEASVIPGQTVCGDCAELTAFGRGQGQQVFSEDFNSGNPQGWGFTQQATFNNPCSPAGVDGTTHIWMGDASPVPRSLETLPYNFTSATSGATVCFDLLFSEQGDASPCEGPDEPDEGVYLQYSTNGGSTWNTIHYYDPNGGNDQQLVNWNNWCFQLPPGAITANTQIRWFQDNDSGADYDHWGIDNVEIFFNDPTYEITWLHDGYNYGQGNSGGANPNLVCPQNSTSYIVEMTNGSSTCRDTVQLTVVNPTIEIDAGNDTTICPNTCATLNATAKVIKSPAKTPTYENNEFEAIATGLGQSTEININITDLNMTNVLPGSITQVCINNLTFFGFNLFPPGQQTIGDLSIELVCPDGTAITLVPSGVTTNSSPLQGYNQTCFTPVATGNIATGTTPYTGNWAPNQPLDNLAGCTANGVWSIRITSASPLSFGSGTFFGWSITFDDPEISYVADISWSPTTNMTGANTLTPTVCPTGTGSTTYTLTATDTAGCVTVTDQVTVTVDPVCCNLEFTGTHVDPTCGASNGSIDITITDGTGPYTFLWSNSATSEDLNNIPAGTYTVTITDNGQPNCVKDTTIILVSPNSPVLNNISSTPETCAGDGDGTATVSASGGTGALSYSWSTTPAQTGATATGLSPGSYTVTITDASGCSVSGNVTVAVGPVCCILDFTEAITQPTCGGSNGSITINISNGTGPYSYAWSNSGSSATISNLSAGSYTVTVTDNGATNCDSVTTFTLTTNNPPTISNMASTPETCAGDGDGTATVTANGQAPLSYSWSTTPAQTNAIATGLSPGNYTVTVTDGNGCTTTDNVSVAAGPNCCTLDFTASSTQPTCGGTDGSISIIITNGVGPYDYLWSNSATTPGISNVGAGTYTVTVTDNGGTNCDSVATFNLSSSSGPTIDNITSTPETCAGDEDGTATVTANGGTPPLTYLWSNAQTTNFISDLTPGNYSVTVEDATGCQAVGNVNVAAGTVCCTLEFEAEGFDPTCGNNDGSITVTIINGSGNYNFAWSNGATTQDITSVGAGTYTIIVTDVTEGCSLDTTITLAASNAPVVNNITATDETCLGDNDGTISLTISGGQAPYQYQWSNNATTQALNGLAPGTYYVTITDDLGCTVVDSATVNPGPNCCGITGSVIIADANCGASDGSIDVTVSGGTPPYSFLWSNNNTTEDLSGISAGSYSVTITAGPNCSWDTTVSVNNINGPVITNISATDETCLGANDGTATVVASGTALPLTTDWSNGVVNQTSITSLSPGTYTVIITDANGCQAVGNVTVKPGPLCCTLTASSTATQASCGTNDGSITVTVDTTSGTLPFAYSIDGGAFAGNNVFNNLSSGTYTIVVQDDQGCTDTLTQAVTEANNTIVLSASGTDPLCAGDNNGAAEATITGGVLPLSVNWSNGDTGVSLTNLAPGTYTVVVTDQNNCSQTASVTLSDPAPFTLDLGPDVALCPGETADLDAGNAASYTWSTGDTTQLLTIDNTGTYFVDALDANGCLATDTISVDIANAINVDAGNDTTIFEFETVQLQATSNSNGTYTWSPASTISCEQCTDPIASPLETTTYTVVLADPQGCLGSDSVTIIVEEGVYFLEYPNAFSPNGDGLNDFLQLFHSGVDRVYWQVFDRWGEKVFESNDVNGTWDGTYKGKELMPDVYVIVIDVTFRNSRHQQLKGSLLIYK